MSYSIDDAFKLLKKRAGVRGTSATITPNSFNEFWKRAELKFFNKEYNIYASSEVISDSISKWMTDPLYIPVNSAGKFTFFTGMNLLHIDSLSAYLPSATTGAIGGFNITAGSGYINGTYAVSLTGGTGTGAAASVIVAGGLIVSVVLTNQGTGYTVADQLTATITGGTGWKITLTSVVTSTPYKIKRVEKNKVAANLASQYDAPNAEFPIYTQYSNSIQFYPSIGIAQIVYLQQPNPSMWAYTLNGNISTLTALVAGSSYTNGIYTNVPLTGGSGNSALATIIVAGGVVTTVTITNAGKLYQVGDTLSALSANVGGTGSGFTINVSSILNPRPIYNASTSVQPLWNDYDISTIVDYALEDVGIQARDNELQQFAQMQLKSA